MASPPVTFPCPFCSRRMGVPAELVGRQVRCPHCKQVVVAPVTAGTAPAPVVIDPPPAPAPAPAPVEVPPPTPEPELRPFNIPQKEGADSILSEPDESDDEVFGSQPGSRLPALPRDPPPAPEPAPVPDDPFGFGPAAPRPAPPAPVPVQPTQPNITATLFDLPPNVAPPAAPPAPVPAPAASSEPANPFAEMEPVALTPSLPQKPVPQPAAARHAPAPAPRPPAAAPAAPASGNPFADFEPAPVPVLVPVPVPAARPKPTAPEADETPEEAPARKRKRDEAEEADRDEKPTRGARPRPAANDGGGAGKTIALIVLAGYAFLATALAVYGLFFKSGGSASDEHPLSTIPDNFGEFDPVSRKKVTQNKFKVDGPLPAAQRAAIGEKVVIGQIEVQPVRIEKRALQIRIEGTNEKERPQTIRTAPALVLTVDIKNTGDLPIFPLDPAFNRRATKADPQPFTRLVVGQKTYFGGEIEWPLSNLFKKKSEVQQANDAIPLKPGESREYVVFTEASLDLVRAAEAAKDPLQWRVQVRRGLIDYKGKEVPVTAIIGVDFRGSEIRVPQ